MGGDLVYRCASSGEDVPLDAWPVHAGLAADVRASEWDIKASVLGSTSGSGERKPREAKLSVLCLTREAADLVAMSFDADSEAGTPGALVAFGEWEQRAISSKVELSKADAGSVVLYVTLVLPDGCWRRVTRKHLSSDSRSRVFVGGIDLGAPGARKQVLDLGVDMPPAPAGPRVVAQPSDVAADSSTTAAVSVVATGYRLSYQWQRLLGGWVAVSGATSSALSVRPEAVGSSAVLRCVVTDALGRSVTSATCRVTWGEYGDMGQDMRWDLSPRPGSVAYSMPARGMASYPGRRGCCPSVQVTDLGSEMVGSELTVGGMSGGLLRIMFAGPCSDPYLRVNGNTYQVYASAALGESIVIDPTRQLVEGGSVYRLKRSGETENLYASRRRGSMGSGSYVFERLPSGTHRVGWEQGTDVDVDVIEERGTIPWT